MDFFWIIILLLAAIFGGLGRTGTARSLWRWGAFDGDYWGGSGWGMGRPLKKRKTDYELRREFRSFREEEVITVSPSDPISLPDNHLELLIADEKLDEAREYRLEMEQIADEMANDDSLRKYAIYGARIVRKEKEISKRERRIKRKERVERRETDWLGFPKEREPVSIPDAKPTVQTASGSAPVAGVPMWRKKTAKPAEKVLPPRPGPTHIPITIHKDSPEPAPSPVVEPVKSRPAADAKPPVERLGRIETKPEPKRRIAESRLEPVKPSPPTERPPIWADKKPEPVSSEKVEEARIGPEYIPPPPRTPPPPRRPVEIPKEFTPPPPGPIQLGSRQESPEPEETVRPDEIPSDFTPPPPGPVQLGTSRIEPSKVDEKPPSTRETPEVEEKEEIDPDEYTDLISL